MANKKTVVQMYEEILAIEGLTDEQKTFLNQRIEITKKKNAKRDSGELTPKQMEKVAETNQLKECVLSVMAEGTGYSPSDLLKLVENPTITSTQKLTPLLSALVADGKVVKTTAKGRSVYSLPTAEADEG